MIEIKIKSIWQGKIAIRDKYISKAKETFDDLLIIKGNDYMVIPCREIEKLIVGKSESPVWDRYSSDYHYLIYFYWKPTTRVQTLF